jgi:predicted Zn-dependent peptidase
MMRTLRAAFALSVLLAVSAAAQDLASFEKRVTVKKLPNGLTVLIMERPEAPVFSFFTLVDAGAVQDPKGQTGLAHMMEHMAFKGTPEIGTTNWPAEKEAIQKLEAAYQEYDREKNKSVGRDDAKVKELEKKWKALADEARKYVKTNEFGEIIEKNGGVGLNATTFMDQTVYFYSFPSNRVELWAYLESSRMMHPVFREFYKERDVVVEERRMRTDSVPIGRLVEQILATAFIAHPYHRPGVGWYDDITNVTISEANDFYRKYYTPNNVTVAIVGDVKAADVLPVVEKYFAPWQGGPKPEDVDITKEPPQTSQRSVLLKEQSQPWYLEGYHRPAYTDPDDAVYDAISDILSNGRTSRMYRSMVRDKKIAVAAAGFNGFPGSKYPQLFLFYAIPNQGHTVKEMEDGIREEIDRLKTQDVTDDELQMYKTRSKAGIIRGLADNEGLAEQLATYQVRYGDWRELFNQIARIEKVTKADIRRVANKSFTDSNRTVGIIENASANAAKAAKGAQQ